MACGYSISTLYQMPRHLEAYGTISWDESQRDGAYQPLSTQTR